MPARDAQVVTIVRAATADEKSLDIYPPTAITVEAPHGADPLSDVALRTCCQLLCNIELPERDNIGLIIGTAFGCLETDRVFDRSRREADGRYASPAAFARTLPSTVAAELALKFSLRGPSLVVSSGATSTALAISRAMRWMDHFHLTFCIAGGVDRRADPPDAKSCAASLLLLGRDVSSVGGPTWRIERTSSACEKATLVRDDDRQRLALWIRTPQSFTISNSLQFTHH